MLSAGLVCASASGVNALDINSPYLKVGDNFFIGTYCHIASGKAQALLKTALGLGRLVGIPADLAGFAFDKVTMKNGDVVCFWLHTNRERQDHLRNENRMSRRHIVDAPASDLTAQTSIFTVNVFGSDKKKIGDKSGSCSNKRHCSTDVVKPSSPAAGVAICIEPQLPGGQKKSIVIAQGAVPVATTNGLVSDKDCNSRKAEFGG